MCCASIMGNPVHNKNNYSIYLGHKLACIQLSQENMTYDVVCYCHEIMESCLSKLIHWRVVKPSALNNPNTVVCTLGIVIATYCNFTKIYLYGDNKLLCLYKLLEFM